MAESLLPPLTATDRDPPLITSSGVLPGYFVRPTRPGVMLYTVYPASDAGQLIRPEKPCRTGDATHWTGASWLSGSVRPCTSCIPTVAVATRQAFDHALLLLAMEGLPPETIHVKRKRGTDDDAVDFLRP